MRNLWSDADAAACRTPLDLRVYTSRLLGGDPALVLHGGGNTSVKAPRRNLFGEEEPILYVKGSGWDLGTIAAAGFTPLRLAPVLRLAELPSMSDSDMARELLSSSVDPAAPAPSVEAILHASLPYTFVDHTHADAIVTLTNSPGGAERIRDLYGDRVVIIPYLMPGFVLAKYCADHFPAEAGPNTVGMVLMNHGLFTFGATAKAAYDLHIELVSMAEQELERRGAWMIGYAPAEPPARPLRNELAALRRELSKLAGAPMTVAMHADAQTLSFANRPDLAEIATRGPATPDHIIRTKRVPLVGRDLADYAAAYRAYFAAHAQGATQPLTMLDPAPRVILDPEYGLLAIGRTPKDAAIVEEIYRHTIAIILRAEALGGWSALPAADLFEVEYWELEQAKLKKAGAPKPFAGEVALVTGAASGIGRGCVEALLARGAAVVGLDLSPAVAEIFPGPGYLGLQGDVSDASVIEQALERAARSFGGLDMLVLNAGIFPAGKKIAALDDEAWRRTLQINLDANLTLLREAHPLLRQAPNGGRVVVIGSKNVPAPGPGAGAYSASKAALTQLARVAALEWGADGIRVNVIHPNAVFDTGIWTDEVLRNRAASYGLSVEAYKTNNLLRVEVTSRDVGELAAELCGPRFAKTTGAQVPIDGGNERVI